MSITQPAVSNQVKELEKAMGGAPPNRTRSGVQLTDTGRALQGLRSGRLSIGSSTTPGEYILPGLIGRFRKRYPGIEVSLSISNTQTIVRRMHRREVNLGLAGAPVEEEGLRTFPYVSDEIVFIAAPDHPAARKAGLSLSDLAGYDLVLREPGSATRQAAEQCLRSCGVAAGAAMELGSNEAVKRAVAAGLGLGMISKFGVEPDVRAGFIEVLDVAGWECRRPLTVFYRDERYLPAAQRAFLRFIQEERPD